MDYYKKVKRWTKKAIAEIDRDGGFYKGYSGGNAVSFYLYKKHNVNVAADNTAQRAFQDAINESKTNKDKTNEN